MTTFCLFQSSVFEKFRQTQNQLYDTVASSLLLQVPLGGISWYRAGGALPVERQRGGLIVRAGDNLR